MAAFDTLASSWRSAEDPTTNGEGALLDHARQLDRFLADVERRAFRIAQIALRDVDDALDAVQDAMTKLASRYAARPAAEWRPLFHRILENTIRDVQRRRTIRRRVMAWVPTWRPDDDSSVEEPADLAADPSPHGAERAMHAQALERLEESLRALPARQRQAFVLRNLEGLDIAETAAAMACSEGSVKTHYSRAVHALRARLGEVW
ncbi:MAG: RNA polymerase sigma factor [Gammaproteobacteria bacterium]|nr:RNA polymerase sigma factor [Gammaproteobacteria bacterium]